MFLGDRCSFRFENHRFVTALFILAFVSRFRCFVLLFRRFCRNSLLIANVLGHRFLTIALILLWRAPLISGSNSGWAGVDKRSAVIVKLLPPAQKLVSHAPPTLNSGHNSMQFGIVRHTTLRQACIIRISCRLTMRIRKSVP